ncbi:ionic transporter y4hA [Mannheimia varigena]|uniref:Calcium/proton antiporter n=1 Tax=Mannheimia varigena USDA-ARS-USMARC-1296 TaxID=1433287 RepID=W0QE49_9PAST|nr:ionic transporter y4hA [Mannheimia varigena]AHG75493.1 Calcium/proton antiporter [Mannheimia varigena USDA-ARS-USMARC-1296]AHG77540.1 Calcium/proton antiporter [Mannheimia varigena USDA-ARS-USMARC-1312]AHG79789.1 Calcium/proton antiporter [Mannheimia varigena USDA-ARS-USMARC-1388]AWW34614.1 ionic transporter y4hA [Mannheimia varigena]QLB16251.1 ionic transporter y4hA [Mannheimia varigena]
MPTVQKGHQPLPIWSLLLPIAAWVIYFVGVKENTILQLIGGALLIGSVLSAVHHAEVVAHKVGEPFGTIILALAITVIEVALIVSLMVAGGDNTAYLARDTVFAAIMLILNGILGGCLLIGGLKHHEQFFSKKSATTALVTLVVILVITLVLPNFTTTTSGATYSSSQLIFVAIASIVLYASFILMQTVRHRDYFLADDNNPAHHAAPPSTKVAMTSLLFLIICLGIVVLLAKALSPAVEAMVVGAGAPVALVGVIIAAVVLLPEGVAALTAAHRNRLQTSINLALGSALASIGLTIPAVVIVCLMFDINMVLGLDWKSMVLLSLSSFVAMLSLNHGQTNMLYGIVLLVILATYVFTVIVP